MSGKDDGITLISIFDRKKYKIDSSFNYGTCRQVNEFEKLNRVGEGTYGIVYR